jgi:hypothetical protein
VEKSFIAYCFEGNESKFSQTSLPVLSPVNEEGKAGGLVIPGYDGDVILEQQQQVTV